MSNRVAIVGATGLVGEALLRILQQRSFPISELVLLASERSAGQIIEFNEQEHEVRLLDDFDFENNLNYKLIYCLEKKIQKTMARFDNFLKIFYQG